MRHSTFLAGFAAAGLVLYLVYLPGLAGPFIYDDNVTILYNSKIQSSSILEVLSEDPFRALPNLTFAAQYHLHVNPARGLPQPRPFHLLNLFLHWLNGLALYAVLIRLRPKAGAWALGASLLFLYHPLLTEAVNFITARFALMATLGYLLAVRFYLDSEKNPRRIIPFWACFIAALFCKEIAATLPATLLILNRWRNKPQKHLIPMTLAFLAFLGLRLGWTIILSSKPEQALGPLQYFLIQNRALWLYLGKFLWPIHLSFDYYLTYPPAGLIPFLLINLALGAIILLYLRRGFAPAAALLIWVILFLPTSSVIPLADLAKEYHAYLPATAIIPLIAAGFLTSSRFSAGRKTVFGVFLVFLAALTLGRNLSWQSEAKLWRDAVTHAPLKHRAVYNYAQTLRRELKLDSALFYYRRALELDPTHQRTRENIEMVEQALHSPDLPAWKVELRRRQDQD